QRQMLDDGAGPRAAPHPHMLPRPGKGTVTIPATAARARLSVPAEDHATDPEDDEAAEHRQRQQRALQLAWGRILLVLLRRCGVRPRGRVLGRARGRPVHVITTQRWISAYRAIA